jgi:hypothetical protein
MVKIGPYKEAMAHHAQHSAAGHGEHKDVTHAVVSGTQAANEHAATTPENHAAANPNGHDATKAEGHAGEEMVQLHGGDNAGHTDINHEEHSANTAMASMSATEKLDATNEAEFFNYSPDMTSGYGLPGLIELGIFLGFGALFVFTVFAQLEKATLVPKKDPYLEETLHHHV